MIKKIAVVVLAGLFCCQMIGCAVKPEEKVEVADKDRIEQEDTDTDTITVTDHNGNVVTVPKNIERIAVGNILPMPSVLAVFFDSAEKLAGIPKGSMTAAENSLLSELYPELLDAKTDYINGAEINLEELMKLDVDLVIYNAANASTKEQLDKAGIPGIAVSVNKWDYDAIETLKQWIALLSEIFPENDRVAQVEAYSTNAYEFVQERVRGLTQEERKDIFFLFQYSDSMITTSGKHFFGQYWADVNKACFRV